MTKYPMKNQMIREIEDELALLQNGRNCCSAHVKISCRNRCEYLNWKMNRIMKDKDFDNPPSTMYVKKPVFIVQKYK